MQVAIFIFQRIFSALPVAAVLLAGALALSPGANASEHVPT